MTQSYVNKNWHGSCNHPKTALEIASSMISMSELCKQKLARFLQQTILRKLHKKFDKFYEVC